MTYTYLITFELKNTKRKYTSLYTALKRLGKDRKQLFANCWAVKIEVPIEKLDISHIGGNWEVTRRKEKPASTTDIFNELEEYLSQGDLILVVDITNQKNYGLLPRDYWPWLRDE